MSYWNKMNYLDGLLKSRINETTHADHKHLDDPLPFK